MCSACGRATVIADVRLGAAPIVVGQTAAIPVMQSLLGENDRQAEHNRAHFEGEGILVVNLMSSPGAGKTTLLEATIQAVGSHFTIAVIEGDLETENDARRIRAAGAKAVRMTTGNACHLDAAMVHAARHRLDLRPVDFLFIENVGNLIRPAAFDLGQHVDVALLSVTEGDDMPEKYPVLFRAADLMVVTKLDVLDAVGDFKPERATRHLRDIASVAPVLELSSGSGRGTEAWLGWLGEAVAHGRDRRDVAIDQGRHAAESTAHG